jgi:hypothetical protein
MVSRPALLAMWLVLALTAGSATAASEQDTQKIREAVKGFVNGLAKGDGVEARRYAASDEITNTLIEAVIPLVKASGRLRDAASTQFGPQGAAFAQQMNPVNAMKQWSKMADEADVQIQGLTASLVPKAPPPPPQQDAQGQDPNATQDQQKAADQRGQKTNGGDPADPNNPRRNRRPPIANGLRLRWESERWRVDLSAMPNAQQLMQMAPMLSTMAESLNDITDEIKAGQFQDITEVQKALRERIMANMIRRQAQGN